MTLVAKQGILREVTPSAISTLCDTIGRETLGLLTTTESDSVLGRTKPLRWFAHYMGEESDVLHRWSCCSGSNCIPASPTAMLIVRARRKPYHAVTIFVLCYYYAKKTVHV